jgi:hypothetical protein
VAVMDNLCINALRLVADGHRAFRHAPS